MNLVRLSSIRCRNQILRQNTTSSGLFATNHLPGVGQGCTLLIDLSCAREAVLHISSAWQDHCYVSCSENVQVVENDGTMGIVKSEKQDAVEVHATVPEIINLVIRAQNLKMVTKNKLAGDLFLSCNSGSVCLDKIRGDRLDLNLGEAALEITRVLEGNASIASGSVKAKMVNGDNLRFDVLGRVDLGSVYSKKVSSLS
jgi:hypothetical protein